MGQFKDWLISEMPIQINKVGNWGDKARPYGYKKDDIGIMKSDKGIEKITRKWSKVPQNFNTYVCRSSQCFKHIEVGEVNADFVQNQLGLKIVDNPTKPDEIKIEPESINYIVTNNRGAERVMLNYWTLAHRFGHAVSAGGRNSRGSLEYQVFEREFWEGVQQLLEGAYGMRVNIKNGIVQDRNARTIIKKLLHAIGTMGSARKEQLREYFEFPHELMAQYIIEQRIRFNPLPNHLQYFKTPERGSNGGYGRYGEPEKRGGYMSNMHAKTSDLEDWNEYLTEMANLTENNLDRVLHSCVGKIYVM